VSPRFGITIITALSLSLLGCGGGGEGSDTDGSSGPGPASAGGTDSDGPTSGGESGDAPDEPRQAASSRANVKPKVPGVLAADLAGSLQLPLESLCQELSSIDCFAAHNIALGGVAPYESAVFDPLPEPGVSSPIAADRIALSACGERVARDFGGDAVLFAEIEGGADDPQARTAVAERLYVHILRRDGEPQEVQALVDLWDALPEHDAKTWAQLSCFALATSLENLFY